MLGRDIPAAFSGKAFASITLGATATAIPLSTVSPTLGARLTALGNVFQEFHFNDVEVRIHPAATAVGVRSDVMVGYSKIIPLASPASFADLYELTASRFVGLADTVPMSLSLGKEVLHHGARVWYTCNAAVGSESEDRQQGLLYVFGPTGTIVNLEIGYSVTFRGATTPAAD